MLSEICRHLFAAGWGVGAKVADFDYGTLQALRQAALFNRVANRDGNHTSVWYDKPYIVCESGNQGGDLCDATAGGIDKPLRTELIVDKSKHVSFARPLEFKRSDWECVGDALQAVMDRAAEQLGARHRGALQTLDTYLLGELYAAATPTLPGGFSNGVNPYGTVSTSPTQVLNPQWNQQISRSMYSIGFKNERKKIIGGDAVNLMRNLITSSGATYQGYELYDDNFNNEVIPTPANGENAVMFLDGAVRLFFYSERMAQFFGGTIEQLGFTAAGTPDYSAIMRRIDMIQTEGRVGVETFTIQDGYGVIWDVKIKSKLVCEPNTDEELVVTVNFICYPVLDFPYGLGTSCELPYSPIWLLNVCLPATPEACDVPVPTPSSNSFCFGAPTIDGCVSGSGGTTATLDIAAFISISGNINGNFDMTNIYGALGIIAAILAQNPGYGSIALIGGSLVYTPGVETDTFVVPNKIIVTLACGGRYTITSQLCNGTEQGSEFRGLEKRAVVSQVPKEFTKEIPLGSTSYGLAKKYEIVSFVDEFGNEVAYERSGATIIFEETTTATTITYK